MTIGTILSLLVTVLVICLVAWLVFWVIQQFNPPEPISKIARIVVVVVAVLLLIGVLLQFTGTPIGLSTPIG
jgi:branched-subunit amino acid transport protein AzlD